MSGTNNVTRDVYYNYGSYLRSRGYDQYMQRLVEELEAGTIPIGAVKANKAGEGATVTGTLTVQPSDAYTANKLPVAGAGQVKVEGGFSGTSTQSAFPSELGLTVNRGSFITGPIVQSTGVSYTRNTFSGGGTSVNEFNARQHVFGSAGTGLTDASSTIVRIRGDLIVDGSGTFASNEVVESLVIEGGPGFDERLFIIYDGTGGTGKDIMDVWTDTSQNVNSDRGTYGDDTYRYDLGFAIDGNPTAPGVDPSDGATQVTGHTRNLRGVTVTSRGVGGVMDIDYKRTELELSGIALDVYGITSINPGPTYDGTDKAPPRIDISGANGGINFIIDSSTNAFINTDGTASFVSVDASSADISGGKLLVKRAGVLDALEVDGRSRFRDISRFHDSIHIDSGSGATIIPFAGSSGTVVIDASAEIRGDISGNRDLRLGGNASIDGSLTVLGETYMDGGFVINGDLSLNSGLKVQNLSRFYSNIVVDGSAQIADKLILGGDASFNDAFDVAGNTTLGGTLGLTGAATFGSTLVIDGDASMNAALKVGGDSTLNGALTLTGDASLNSGLVVTGDASINALFITEPDSSKLGLHVIGSQAQFNKSVSIYDSVTNFTTISGGSITSAGADWHAVRASGLALRVTGDSSFNGDVVVTGDCSVDGTSQVRNGSLDPSASFASVALGVSGGAYFSDVSGGNHTDLGSNSQLFWISNLPHHTGGSGASTVEFVHDGGNIGYLARAASSRRFKTNIETVDVNYASRMYDVDARSYTDLAGNGRTIGLIAEEVNDAGLSEFVTLDSDGLPRGLRYAEMVAPLLTLVKDQKARIEKLESDVAYLLEKAGGR